MPWLAPLARALDDRRRAAIPDVLERHADIVGALPEAFEAGARGDERARRLIEHAATELLRDIRGRPEGAAGAIDARLRTETQELMDRAGVPAWIRRLEVSALDWQNRLLGVYPEWIKLIDAALQSAPARRLYELASGNGGFARHLAAKGGYDVTASDLNPIFVDRARGASPALENLRFEVRDAANLGDLRGSVDLFVCMQAAHHLPPGALLAMIGEGVRAGTAGILVVDLMRSLMLLVGGVFVDLFTAPFPPFMVDGILSFRRSYLPSELELLALAAGAEDVEARFVSPGYLAMRARGVVNDPRATR